MAENITLLAVGDIFLRSNRKGSPFKFVEKILQSGDIVFGNFETVLSADGIPKKKAVLLRTCPEAAEYLKQSGFNVLNLANNHTMDYSLQGLEYTIEALNRYCITNIVGVDFNNNRIKFENLVVIDCRGIKIGFLGYQAGIDECLRSIDEETIFKDIDSTKLKSDIIVISLHWGTEYVHYPSPEQQKLARRIIDAGANVILGHHPHVIQGIERYKHGIILYSLGNFNFGGWWDENFPDAKVGIIAKLHLSKAGLEGFEIIPVKQNQSYQPVVVSSSDGRKRILDFLKDISHCLQQCISSTFWYNVASENYFRNNIPAFIYRIRKYGISHGVEAAKWLITPYTMKMYLGWIYRNIVGTRSDKR